MKQIVLALMFIVANLNAGEIYATFTVKADKSANLAFSSSGIVDRVFVDVASIVKKGDVLAKLKNDDLKAMLETSKTSLKYAKKEYDRQLKVKNMIDRSKLDSYAYKYENSKNQVAYQKALYDKTFLKAPFDGIIYEKSVEVGDVVSGAMIRTVLKLQSLHKRKLILEFDQKYWKDVKIGKSFVYKIDGDPISYTGKISKVYPVANSKSRKIKAEVEAKDFIVGLFGEGYIKGTLNGDK